MQHWRGSHWLTYFSTDFSFFCAIRVKCEIPRDIPSEVIMLSFFAGRNPCAAQPHHHCFTVTALIIIVLNFIRREIEGWEGNNVLRMAKGSGKVAFSHYLLSYPLIHTFPSLSMLSLPFLYKLPILNGSYKANYLHSNARFSWYLLPFCLHKESKRLVLFWPFSKLTQLTSVCLPSLPHTPGYLFNYLLCYSHYFS